jgi:hypothetical protein
MGTSSQRGCAHCPVMKTDSRAKTEIKRAKPTASLIQYPEYCSAAEYAFHLSTLRRFAVQRLR